MGKILYLCGDPSLFLFGLDFNEETTPLCVKKRTFYPENEKNSIIVRDNILLTNMDDVKSIYVYSITGQLLLKKNTNAVNVENLPAGIYMTVVKTENKDYTHKIILQ